MNMFRGEAYWLMVMSQVEPITVGEKDGML